MVRSTLQVERNGRHGQPLRLNAQALKLLCVAVGGAPVDFAYENDLLTVPIKTGEYRFGQVTKLVTFKNTTYNLVVTKPK